MEFEVEEFSEKPWYKVILLFEDSLTKYLSITKKLCFLPNKTTVIMPMTTSVEVGKDEASLWVEQLRIEQELFNSLAKSIDESGFLFYSDLVNGDSKLLKFFFNQLERGLLIDPNIELTLQSLDELVSVIVTNILINSVPAPRSGPAGYNLSIHPVSP